MGLELLTQADYVLNSCGRPVPPKGYKFVDLPKIIPFHHTPQFSPGGLAMSFDFYPTGTEQESYYEQNAGQVLPPNSPTMSLVGSLNSPANNEAQCSQPGPWVESPTVRYQILIDPTGNKLRAYMSTNRGATWAEQNAAGAPTVNNNATFPPDYTFYAVARNTNPAVKVVYCAFWDTDETVSFISFSFATNTWGAKVKSTLAYGGVFANITSGISGFAAIFRPSDGSFIIALNQQATAGGFDRAYYAKFNTGTLTWDANWTACGDTNPADRLKWFPTGMVLDAAGNVHIQFGVDGFNVPQVSYIYHQVLHPDNSLSVPDIVTTIPQLQTISAAAFLGRPVARPIPGGGTELLFTWNQTQAVTNNLLALVARAPASDAPVWVTETMADFAGAVADEFAGWQLINLGNGLIGGVGIAAEVGGNAQWYLISNSGPGAGWTLTPFTVTTAAQTAGKSNGYIALALSPGTFTEGWPTQDTVANNSNTLFLCKGLMFQTDPVQVRLRWPNGRYWNQTPSPNPIAGNSTAFPQGTGGNLFALDEEVAIEAGGKVAIEMSGPNPGNVDVYLWGYLRYLLRDTGIGQGGDVDGKTCILGYPAQAQSQGPPSCLIGYPVTGPGLPGIKTIQDPVQVLKLRPRFSCWPNGNIYAPEFRLGNQCETDTPKGYEDESFNFQSGIPAGTAYVIPGGGQNYSNQVGVPGQEDVILRRFRAIVTWSGGATGIPLVQLRLPNGYSLTGGDQIPLNLGYWIPVFPTLKLAAGTLLIIDLADSLQVDSGSINVVIEFDAVKRRKLV